MGVKKAKGSLEYANALKDIYLRLHNDRKVKSQADFARQIDFTPIAASEMIRAIKPIPFRLLKKVYHTFNVNVNYIIGGGINESIYRGQWNADSMVNEPAVEFITSREHQLLKEIETLKNAIKDKEKIIALLEKQKP